MADATMRQIEMLRMIPRQGKVSVQQLCKNLLELGYETTQRSVQRDLQTLSARVPIECDNSSKPHGWSWSKDAPAWNLPGLGLTEAFALQLLEKFGPELMPAAFASRLKPYFITARQQINREFGPDRARNWLRKVRFVSPSQPLLPAKAATEVLEALHSALMRECCLSIQYKSDRGRKVLVHPLGLVQHDSVLYGVVNFDGFDDVRLIAVHRIRHAEVLDRACEVPAGFELDRYIADGALGFGEMGKTIRLKIKLLNHAGQHLRETPLSEDQTLKELGAGSLQIQASVQLTRRLRWWLLGFGADLEVLGPAELRREIKASLQAALASYAPAVVHSAEAVDATPDVRSVRYG